MDVRRILIIGVGSALAIFAVIAALPAEGDPLIATVGKPAIVTAAPAKPQEGLQRTRGRLASWFTSLVTSLRRRAVSAVS